MEMAGRVPADRSFAGTLKNRMRGRTGALMLIVKKFGGSSVANKERIFNVAKRCIEDYKAGHDVVVVLSAMGDTTD